MIDELLKIPETDLNLTTVDGKCALQFALLSSKFTDFSVAKRIIDNGADTNEVLPETGDNLLQFLIKSEAEEASTFMCDHVNLNFKNRDGLTSLHLAGQKNLAKLVTKMLSCGASPNVQSGVEEQKTALHYAIEGEMGKEVLVVYLKCSYCVFLHYDQCTL
jgi:ankyrin repeat protein